MYFIDIFDHSVELIFLRQVTESDAVDVVEIAIKHHASDITTKAMAIIALLKLSSRFPSCSEYVIYLPSMLLLFHHVLLPGNPYWLSFFINCPPIRWAVKLYDSCK